MLLFTFMLLFAADDWTHYGKDAGGTRYSKASRVDRSNVAKLEKAWEFRTGALTPGYNRSAAFESTPILIEGTLYLTSPFNHIYALDPKSGALRWTFNAGVDPKGRYSEVTSRGVAAWIDPKARNDADCRLTLFEGTIDARLIAIDGKTGKPCPRFGVKGTVELGRDIGVTSKPDYLVTSAPTVVGDVVIVGSAIGDNYAVDAESGVVRGFDARTGSLRWSWNPTPWAAQNKPRTGAANAWSTFAADESRGLIFIPTGSASPDFYGGLRPGDNRWANSVVALRAATGEFVWGYQVVHHDLWDYDVASQPLLLTYKARPAVAVNTKMGHVFVLDRETGKPLHEVEERKVPLSDVVGETAHATQPIPQWEAVTPSELGPNDVWGPTPEAEKSCRELMANLRAEGLFTPPSLKGTILFPGNAGGVNWGSAAFDPDRQFVVVNTNRLATVVRLLPAQSLSDERKKLANTDQRFSGEFGTQRGAPFAMYRKLLLSSVGTPCNRPPWGAIVAFDLKTGKRRWETPLGTVPIAPGVRGSPNLGGPIVTAGGLVFSAASMDTNLYAFDIDTGREVWKGELPASAQSTPMTYEINGEQYVVICAGGHGKLGTKMGDSVVAFKLRTQ